MQKWFELVLALSLSVFCHFVSAAEPSSVDTAKLTLKYEPSGSNSWFPYYIDAGERTGIIPELIKLVLQQAAMQGEEVALPAARTNYALDNGAIDFDFINPDWLPANTPMERYVFSVPIIPVKESFIALASTDISTLNSQLAQSEPLKIGTVLGYYYHDDHLFKRVDFSSEKNLIRALAQGRIKYAICDDLTAQYWSEQLAVPINIGTVHSDGFLHIRFRRELAEIVPKINQAINKLQQSGKITAIMNSYLVSDLQSQ